jgi:4-alpha-glucanotransferase
VDKRGSGILLHISSLPSPYGIGDLGPSAYSFADFLGETCQSYWQILPLNPTASILGNSPYSSISTFAGNTLFVSPDILLRDGLISQKDLIGRRSLPNNHCEYELVTHFKERIIATAYNTFKNKDSNKDNFAHFCECNQEWLDTFSLFVAIKKRMEGKPWNEWPLRLRDRHKKAIDRMRIELADDIEQVNFAQFLFFTQWNDLKNYCNHKGIRIIGDVPIYASHDSADGWSNPQIFKFNDAKRPYAVAGVPPDYFSDTGQLWGNPVYNWDVLKKSKYKWWIKRIQHVLSLYDIMRIDHFRGLVAYWEVPAHEVNAINGRWVDVPTDEFFTRLSASFSHHTIIAEDLGIITDDVRRVMGKFKFPGMKVLLFAFGDDNPMHPYLPHTYEKNCVVYTGTHDNNTVRGWFDHEATVQDKSRLFRYLGRVVRSHQVSNELVRLAMMSVADTVIIPMQDILGLGKEGQMNRPSTASENWEWRLRPSAITIKIIDRFRSLTIASGRASDE